MNMPSKCPVCGDNMLNTFGALSILHKKCCKRLNHNIEFIADPYDEDSVAKLIISLNEYKTQVVWNYFTNSLIIKSNNNSDCHLPFFDPDLSNYKRLINKLKTYTIFS